VLRQDRHRLITSSRVLAHATICHLTVLEAGDRVTEDTMSKNYDGLPAAANVEQSIVLAQLMILQDLERRAKLIAEQAASVQHDLRPAA
jgi:hypothetical protein